jgi:Protein of unknown function (DUF3631)
MTAPNVPPREVIDGAQLLHELHAAFGKYVVFPSAEAHDAAVLWCAATHGQPAWEHAPRLTLTSPEKRCGKSRLMDVAEAVCYEPLVTVNASTAAVVRSITDDPPTLMVDEADTIFGTKKAAENHEDVRGIINAGHQRNRPYVRWDITSRSRELCPTFAMVMLAAIGGLPDTIMDRAIDIRMRRRSPGEKVAPFRTRRDAPPLRSLRDRVGEWVRSNISQLQQAVPVLPIEDRAADTWEPLFAIADLAGGDWPQRANRACLALTGTDPDDAADGTRLLADLKTIWGEDEAHLFSTTIIERLHKIEEAPWSEWGWERKPITQRGLADLLRPYRVKPKTVRIGGDTAKGYARADLTDPWTRYVTEVTASQEDEKGDPTSGNACDGSVTEDASETDTASDKDKQADCDGVSDVTAQVRTSDKCRGCGAELRPHLQARGTCGPCNAKEAGDAE